MVLSEVSVLIGVPVLRSVAGWLENAAEDGKFDKFEVKELLSTVLRVGFVGTAAFFGLNGLGVDVSVLGASFSAVILDFLFKSFKY